MSMQVGSENQIERVMSAAMGNIKQIVDVDTVIGRPLTGLDGSMIIPFSKVTIGFLVGGGEYGELKSVDAREEHPFAGGSGAYVQIDPSGFLIAKEDEVKTVTLGEGPLDRLFDSASELLNRIKANKEAGKN